MTQVEKLGGKGLLFWNNDKFIFAILNFTRKWEKWKPEAGHWQKYENKLCREKRLEGLSC